MRAVLAHSTGRGLSRVLPRSLVEHTRLVRGHHVFDVYEGVVTAMALKRLKCLLNEVAEVLPLLLAVVDAVARVHYNRNGTLHTAAPAAHRNSAAALGTIYVSSTGDMVPVSAGPRFGTNLPNVGPQR